MIESMIQLVCTHCSHRFELEKQEGALCPSCGWSSTVIPVSELENQTKKSVPQKATTHSLAWLADFSIFALKILAGVALIILIIFGIIKFLGSHHSVSHDVKVIQVERQTDRAKKTSAAPSVLTTDEQALLSSGLQITVEPQLSDQEQQLLQRAVDLRAGNVEKLPSVNWTADQFKQYVEAQEKQFHMPLPRSYKKNLQELFQQNYAVAYNLFLAGKLQQARDAYVASLGLPVYENDVRKHRAVVLTMLRSFVNDTIAKIGAMNFALARQSSSGQDEQVGSAYAGLQQQIRSSQWSEALESIKKIQAILPESSVGAALQAPPYTKGFEKVDADIQPVLYSLLQVPAWTFDLNELKADLEVKKSLLSQLADPDRKSSIESYGKAIEKIQSKSWNEALALLREVKSPVELKQDAEKKISLIDKLNGAASAMEAR